MYETLRYILSPLVPAYTGVIKFRNYLFDKGYFKSKKAGVPVISIGNITVGGSGKTPLVIYVTNLLKEAGKNPGILSRGYGRKSKGYRLVSRKGKPVTDVRTSGDEIRLASDECKVSAAVAESRVSGAKKLIRDTGVDSIVLDDAFQHRWIQRDLNLVIFDQRFLTKESLADQAMLPLGLMREPFSGIERADAVIINRKFSEKKEIPEEYMKYFEGKDIFYAHYKTDGIIDIKTRQKFRIGDFEGQKSLVVCGIAKPYSFLHILETNNIDIKNKMLFTDHKDYTNHEVKDIRKKFYDTNSYSVLTTQKDAVKLSGYAREMDDIDIYFLKITMVFEEPEKFRDKILSIYNTNDNS